MTWYKQTFSDGETVYALSHETFLNGHKKAVIVSDIYKKAKNTSLQNMTLWKTIQIEDVPTTLRRKLLDKAGK